MTTSPTPAGAPAGPDPDGRAVTAPDPTVTTTRRHHLNEDWLATVVGLALLALVLTGVIGAEVLP